MYIELTKNNGIDYLRLVKNVRLTNSKGIKTSTKKVVFNIGPLSRFDDGNPDYVARLNVRRQIDVVANARLFSVLTTSA